MFYIKKGKRRHYISPDNVYSKCPKCGKDVPVDLGDWIEEDIWDISGVFCDDCAAKYNANGNDNG